MQAHLQLLAMAVSTGNILNYSKYKHVPVAGDTKTDRNGGWIRVGIILSLK